MSRGSAGSFGRRHSVSGSIDTLTLLAVAIRPLASGIAQLGQQPTDWCVGTGPLVQASGGSRPRRLPESRLGQAIIPKGPGVVAEFDDSGLKSRVVP